ncbi:MAG: LysR family transcriptional activator of nhaA [Candidatus Azotimanducaceae bacterium]|jgi:LysR family transcriptional activator of nhaA
MYFWTVAREGSIARAAEVMHLTPQTISGQIKLLEESISEPLFAKAGRGLVLTETGHVVKQYADEIFSLGQELTYRLKTKQALMPTTMNVGIVDSTPKLVALRVLQPAFELEDAIKVVCREGSLEQLLGDLAIHKLDLLISDRPVPTGTHVKAYNHPLGSSSISFFAKKELATQCTKDFPACLDGAPLLLPVQESPTRRAIDEWLDNLNITPNVLAEFEDSALLKAFGEAGIGIFPAPTAIAEEVCTMYKSVCIGVSETVVENYYAISPERKLKHPAVLNLTEQARQKLFI